MKGQLLFLYFGQGFGLNIKRINPIGGGQWPCSENVSSCQCRRRLASRNKARLYQVCFLPDEQVVLLSVFHVEFVQNLSVSFCRAVVREEKGVFCLGGLFVF